MADLKIYEISDALLDALDAVEVDEETGEIKNTEALAAVKADAQLKIVSTAKYLAMRGATLAGMKTAYRSLGARIKAEERRQEWLKAQALKGMIALGVTKIESPDIEVKLGKLPPSVRVLDEAQIPAEYIKVKTEQSVDKIALSAALKAGKDVPGVMLVTNGQKIIIK